MVDITKPVSILPSIGTYYTQKLAKLGIVSIQDLLHYYPVRYDDLSATTTITSLNVSDKVTLKGTIHSFYSRRIAGNRSMQTAVLSDDTGNLRLTWFNQPYLEKTIHPDTAYQVSGTIKAYRQQLTLNAPAIEPLTREVSASQLHTGRLVPQYAQTAGITSKWLRRQISHLLNQVDFHLSDPLPQKIKQHYQLIDLTSAIKQIHFPDSYEAFEGAKNRLAFDEMFHYQLVSKFIKQSQSVQITAIPLNPDSSLDQFIKLLPFTLTNSQSQAVRDIQKDLQNNTPMHRLLQGDVGSGKTAVAAASAYTLASQGYTTLLMAPTQVLAEQHYHTFLDYFKKTPYTIGLLTGSRKHIPKSSPIIIGTHALLHQPPPPKLGLVIIDEQHRFGVTQRASLLNGTPKPHFLSMTATPIPRTIALTLYSQLEISSLTDMPHGRLPVKTSVVAPKTRTEAYSWIKAHIDTQKAQVFYVCPLIEASITPKLSQVKAVQEVYSHLSDDIFPQYKIGLLHGRLSATEKQQVLTDFRHQQYQILVSTPVIEVGVDIPTATIMVVESAERFGLASLHQLRGRVGRSDKQSFCLLFPSNTTTNLTRLKHLETTHSGIKLAQIDMEIRGPGNMFGTKQSGYIDLKIASLTDLPTITHTHQAATTLLSEDPTLFMYPELLAQIRSLLDKVSTTD